MADICHSREQPAATVSRVHQARQRVGVQIEQAEVQLTRSSALWQEAHNLGPAAVRTPAPRPGAARQSAFTRLLARRATMPTIERAKGILIAQSACDDARAFDLLRQASQRLNIPVRDLAAQIVARAEKAVSQPDLSTTSHPGDVYPAPLQASTFPPSPQIAGRRRGH